jgi:hypothetical protein
VRALPGLRPPCSAVAACFRLVCYAQLLCMSYTSDMHLLSTTCAAGQSALILTVLTAPTRPLCHTPAQTTNNAAQRLRLGGNGGPQW